MPAISPAVLTYTEAETYLSCGHTWLKQQVRKGNVAVTRYGSNVRFTKAALDDFVVALTKPASTTGARPGQRPSLASRKAAAGIA